MQPRSRRDLLTEYQLEKENLIMGCNYSTKIEPNDKVDEDMSLTSDEEVKWQTKLTHQEARTKYIKEGTLPVDADDLELEFRGLLDDAIARIYVEKFIVEEELDAIYACWNDTYHYSMSTEIDNLRLQLDNIIRTHLQPECQVYESCVSVGREDFAIQTVNMSSDTLSSKELGWLNLLCFENLFRFGYLNFRKTERHARMLDKLNTKVNVARPDDFEYANVIGEGGFGVVIQCRKKTTGMCYAMKIQLKEDVAHQCHSAERLDFEKQAFASLKHPFIVELSYAFQTRTLVMLVMTLGTYKDLSDVIMADGCLSLERTRFYVAELTCALSYIHSMGLVYRDLKPRNVLLQANGHILLIDFGSVTDLYGRTLQPDRGDAPLFMREYDRENALFHNEIAETACACDTSSQAAPTSTMPTSGLTFAPSSSAYITIQSSFVSNELMNADCENNIVSFSQQPSGLVRDSKSISVLLPSSPLASPVLSGRKETAAVTPAPPDTISNQLSSSHSPRLQKDVVGAFDSVRDPMRARSVIGTIGFMAPEIAVMMAQDKFEHQGYTKAVDWWALGCTMYKLLTGSNPFMTESASKMLETGMLEHSVMKQYQQATKYDVLFDEVDYSAVSNEPDAISFMMALLAVDEEKRLGYGPNGSSNVKAHSFFTGVDWGLMDKAKLTPPYVPPSQLNDVISPRFSSLADCVQEVGKPSWMNPRKVGHLQKYFNTWNYTSASVVCAEFDHLKTILPEKE